MASVKTDVSGLSAEISACLRDYVGEVEEVVKAAVDETAKEMVAEIRENARQAFPDGTGEYAKSWTHKVDKSASRDGRYSRVAYAKGSAGSISHLLEHGHAKVNGGTVPGRPHIAPAEKHAEERLPQRIKEGLRSGKVE